MSKPIQATAVKEREIHTYMLLWHASNSALKNAAEVSVGQSWQYLSSLTSRAFSFEAYLNHVGKQLFSCWEEGLERLSNHGKFNLICEYLKIEFPAGRGARPLQTYHTLMQLRNDLAHGKTENISEKSKQDVNNYLDTYLGETPLLHWKMLIQNSNFAEQARDDMWGIMDRIRDALPTFVG